MIIIIMAMCVSNTRCIIHNTNKHVYIGIGIAIVSVIVCTSDSDNVYNNHGTTFEHFRTTQSWLDPAKTQVIGLKLPLTFGKLNSQSTLGDFDSDHLSQVSFFHVFVDFLPSHKGSQLQLV